MARRFLAFLILAGLGSTTFSQTVTTLPVERPWFGLPQVSALLNGRTGGRFIVDSAASETVLTDALLARLGLTGSGTEARVNGSTGSTPIRYYRLESLALGGRTFRNVGAYGFPPLSAPVRADGLIGADILRRHVVEFDLPRNSIRLHPPRTDFLLLDGSGDWSAIPVRQRRDGFLIVTVTIGSLRLPALVDTGASQNFVNRAASRRLGLRFVPDSESREAVTGASGHVQTVNQIDLSRLAIGDVELGPSRIGVADLAIFESLGVADRPAMILGANALEGRRFVLDYPRSRLLIERQRP